MKIRLNMTRQQYQGVITIAGNSLRMIAGETFRAVQMRDALHGLLMRSQMRLLLLKERGNRLSLNDSEALALYECCASLADRFFPYERATAYWLLEQIDRQRMDYLRRLRANLGDAQADHLALLNQ